MVGPARENRDMARYAAAPHPRVLFALVAALVLALAGCSGAGGAGGGSEGGSGGELDRNAALRAATWANDVARAEQLIAAGADVNAKDETQQSAFLITTSEGYDAILDLTLAHGARVDDLDSWNGTGLIRAAERGHHTTVGRLLRAGIARDHVNRIGYQAIHEAVWFGADAPDELTTVQVLIAGGVQLDRPSETEGLTPVQMARDRGYRTLERALAAAAAHEESSTPVADLRAAVAAGDADAAALALRDGASRELPAAELAALVGSAQGQGHREVHRLLTSYLGV